jgi:hypothetical protein
MNLYSKDGRVPVQGRRISVNTSYHNTAGVVDWVDLYRSDNGYRWQMFLIEDSGERNRYELLAIAWEYEDKTLLPCGYHFPCPCDP